MPFEVPILVKQGAQQESALRPIPVSATKERVEPKKPKPVSKPKSRPETPSPMENESKKSKSKKKARKSKTDSTPDTGDNPFTFKEPGKGKKGSSAARTPGQGVMWMWAIVSAGVATLLVVLSVIVNSSSPKDEKVADKKTEEAAKKEEQPEKPKEATKPVKPEDIKVAPVQALPGGLALENPEPKKPDTPIVKKPDTQPNVPKDPGNTPKQPNTNGMQVTSKTLNYGDKLAEVEVRIGQITKVTVDIPPANIQGETIVTMTGLPKNVKASQAKVTKQKNTAVFDVTAEKSALPKQLDVKLVVKSAQGGKQEFTSRVSLLVRTP